MLATTELQEIREQLELSQNPLFFFDNDADGLCSYIILRRAINRGKGVAIKSFPDLNETYLRKIEELNPDSIFILDKPQVSKGFIDELEKRGIPVTWIDHHEVQVEEELLEKVSYYNSFPTSEPVTYICQKIFDKKEDLWIAMIGCTSDVYTPDFAEKFEEEHPELFNSKISAFDALNSTEIGKFARMLNFGLMDTTTNILNMMRYLISANGPYDLLEENHKTKSFHKRYSDLLRELEKLMKKAEEQINTKDKILFFTYGGQTSMSSEVSNRLYYEHRDKLIVVIYKRENKANISLRGKNVKNILAKTLTKIEGSKGGGHEEACGAMIPLERLEDFKKIFQEESEKIS